MSDLSKVTQPPQIHTYAANVTFSVTDVDTELTSEHTYALANDINFVTAHPCVPSTHVKIMKSPSSPTIQQVDLSGSGAVGKTASVVGTYSQTPSSHLIQAPSNPITANERTSPARPPPPQKLHLHSPPPLRAARQAGLLPRVPPRQLLVGRAPAHPHPVAARRPRGQGPRRRLHHGLPAPAAGARDPAVAGPQPHR